MRTRSVVVVAIAVFALLGVLSPPAVAQAPAPKVTINGLIDTVTWLSSNYSQEDRDFSRRHDHEWVTRNRGVFTLWGEVGKVKGALALEFDINWGNSDTPWGTAPPAVAGAARTADTNCDFGQNDDVNFCPEVKWLFVEFPLAWIPGNTIVRLGGQNDRWTYKPAVVTYTDSPGVVIESTWNPMLKSRLAYFQYNQRNVGITGAVGNRTSFLRGDSWSIQANLEVSPFKGLDIMPLYMYWQQGPIGTQAGSGSTAWEPGRGGVAQLNTAQAIVAGVLQGSQAGGVSTVTSPLGTITGAAPCAAVHCKEDRHYFGIDARFKTGIVFFNPTFIYQIGERDIVTPVAPGFPSVALVRHQKEHSFLLDLEGGVSLGPLTVPVMVIYSPGNKAKDNIGNRGSVGVERINYYQAVYIDTGYGSGRITEIFAPNSVDYIKRYAVGTSLQEGATVGYDRYGRIDLGVRPKYALTPALTIGGLVATHWTAEQVDTNATFNAATGLIPTTSPRGRRHLGEELAVFLTYAFIPGVTFDWTAGIFFPGAANERCKSDETAAVAAAALATGTCASGQRTEPHNAYWTGARVRYQF